MEALLPIKIMLFVIKEPSAGLWWPDEQGVDPATSDNGANQETNFRGNDEQERGKLIFARYTIVPVVVGTTVLRCVTTLKQESTVKKLEMKDLTQDEKAEIKQLLQKAQANADHPLTNGERNKIREEGRLKIVADRTEAARVASKLAREKAKERAKNQILPETFSWIDSVSGKFRNPR